MAALELWSALRQSSLACQDRAGEPAAYPGVVHPHSRCLSGRPWETVGKLAVPQPLPVPQWPLGLSCLGWEHQFLRPQLEVFSLQFHVGIFPMWLVRG